MKQRLICVTIKRGFNLFFVDKNKCLLYHECGDIMKINKIIKLKNGSYKIKIDDFYFITYDDLIIKYNLLYKKDLDLDILKKINDESLYYENYNKLVKFATKRVRCEKEIIKFLENNDISQNDIKKMVDKLKNNNLLNEKIYVESYINDKILFSKDSIYKIRSDLLNNDIGMNIIDDIIDNLQINDKERLEKIIRKKVEINHKYSSYYLKNKLLLELTSLGYDKTDIIDVFDNYSKNDYAILIKEYKKIHAKYSKKYKENELVYILKNKLYQKGFNYDDIKKEDL